MVSRIYVSIMCKKSPLPRLGSRVIVVYDAYDDLVLCYFSSAFRLEKLTLYFCHSLRIVA